MFLVSRCECMWCKWLTAICISGCLWVAAGVIWKNINAWKPTPVWEIGLKLMIAGWCQQTQTGHKNTSLDAGIQLHFSAEFYRIPPFWINLRVAVLFYDRGLIKNWSIWGFSLKAKTEFCSVENLQLCVSFFAAAHTTIVLNTHSLAAFLDQEKKPYEMLRKQLCWLSAAPVPHLSKH